MQESESESVLVESVQEIYTFSFPMPEGPSTVIEVHPGTVVLMARVPPAEADRLRPPGALKDALVRGGILNCLPNGEYFSHIIGSPINGLVPVHFTLKYAGVLSAEGAQAAAQCISNAI